MDVPPSWLPWRHAGAAVVAFFLIPAARVMNHWKEKRRGHLKKELETVANAIAKAKFGQRKAAKHRKENAKLSEKLKALD